VLERSFLGVAIDWPVVEPKSLPPMVGWRTCVLRPFRAELPLWARDYEITINDDETVSSRTTVLKLPLFVFFLLE
jgi:hypothetical protein